MSIYDNFKVMLNQKFADYVNNVCVPTFRKNMPVGAEEPSDGERVTESIEVSKVNDRTYKVSCTSRHAKWANKGRGAIDGKLMHFQINGEDIWTKHVGAMYSRNPNNPNRQKLNFLEKTVKELNSGGNYSVH